MPAAQGWASKKTVDATGGVAVMEAALTALSTASPDAASDEARLCVKVAVAESADNTAAAAAVPVVTVVKFTCSWVAASRRRAATSDTEAMEMAEGASFRVVAIELVSVAFCVGPNVAADRPVISRLDACVVCGVLTKPAGGRRQCVCAGKLVNEPAGQGLQASDVPLRKVPTEQAMQRVLEASL